MATCAIYTFEAAASPANTFTYGGCWPLPVRVPCGSVRPLYAECPEPCLPLPYKNGDVLGFQWQLPDRLNNWPDSPLYGIKLTALTTDWLVAVFVVDMDTNTETPLYEPELSGFVGWRSDGTRFQQIAVDTTNFPRSFALKVVLNQGLTERVEYTETYCRVKCEPTITVTADTDGSASTKCGGVFAATEFAAADAVANGTLAILGTYFRYVPSMRLYGDVTWQGASVSRQLLANTGYPTQTTTTRRHTVIGGLLSPAQADALLTVLRQNFVTIVDDAGVTVYGQFSGDFVRNLERGRRFVSRFDITELPCIDSAGCIT